MLFRIHPADSPWRCGHIEVQNWANGPQCSWLCTSFMNFLCSPNLRPILTMLCKVLDIHIRNSSPSHQISCFIYCIYLISFLKLIPVWIDSEPNSCQWNSTRAYRDAILTKEQCNVTHTLMQKIWGVLNEFWSKHLDTCCSAWKA